MGHNDLAAKLVTILRDHIARQRQQGAQLPLTISVHELTNDRRGVRKLTPEHYKHIATKTAVLLVNLTPKMEVEYAGAGQFVVHAGVPHQRDRRAT